jgi:hypothetical protein
MFSGELMDLLPQVIKSWQVIAATIAIVLCIYFANYVARLYHRPRSVSKSKAKKVKTQKAPPAEKPAEKDDSDDIIPKK